MRSIIILWPERTGQSVCSSNNLQKDGNDGNNQEDMNDPGRLIGKKADGPCYNQNDSDDIQ